MMTNYKSEAKKLLSLALGVEINAIEDDASPSNIKNWDSLNQVKLSILIEEYLGRKLSTDEILGLISLDYITDLLSKEDTSN
jgi:acyl carrier protein